MAETKTYDPSKHFITFAGIPLSGFAKGTYLTVTRLSDTFEDYAGTLGEVCRTRKLDRRATAKFKTMGSSPINDALSAVARTDESTGEGQGVFGAVDGNGTTVLNASSAWIVKQPDAEFGDTMPEREWEIRIAVLDTFLGGNS